MLLQKIFHIVPVSLLLLTPTPACGGVSEHHWNNFWIDDWLCQAKGSSRQAANRVNTMLPMHTLHPEDSHDYYRFFTQMWSYIDRCLIDHTCGGWYNYRLDTYPENRRQRKSHAWNTTYHNTRGFIHNIHMLKEKFEEQ